jgi:CRISPR-associated endoribonuclease Cas6
MRLYIHANCEEKPRFRLPWNYHLSVINFVYESIGTENPEKASRLHQSPDSPPFSFSNFIQTGPFQPVSDGISFSRGFFCFTSSDQEVIQSIADNVPSGGDLMVGNTKVPVVDHTVESITRYSGETEYETLSPIAVSEQYVDDGTREWYLPSDAMWASRIKENLKGRIEGKVGLHDSFRFKIVNFDWVDKKVKRLTSDIEIPCARARFTLDTDEKTSRFIQNNGLGQRTGMGFGSVIPKTDMHSRWR